MASLFLLHLAHGWKGCLIRLGWLPIGWPALPAKGIPASPKAGFPAILAGFRR
jgi:hypothetical protein